jgi:ankyrin repeat protein
MALALASATSIFLAIAFHVLYIKNKQNNHIIILKMDYTKLERFGYHCCHGELDAIKEILNESTPEKYAGKYLLNGFDMACLKGHLNIIEYLTNNFNMPISSNKYLCFSLACEKGHLDIIKYLIANYYIDIHVSDEYPLRQACINGQYDVVVYLTKLHLTNRLYNPVRLINDVNFKNACMYGYLDIIIYLTTLYKESKFYHKINTNNYCFIRGLVLACSNNHYDILKYLLELYKYDGNYKPIIMDITALYMTACKNGHFKIVKYLTTLYFYNINYEKIDERQANFNIKDNKITLYLLKLYRKHKVYTPILLI